MKRQGRTGDGLQKCFNICNISSFKRNSRWEIGPPWSYNYLIIKSLRKYGKFYDEHLLVEYPVGSGIKITLSEVANRLTERIISLFLKNEKGERNIYGPYNWFYKQEENKHLLQFYEYFHGDTGQGLGASHQTGWTALIAPLLRDILARASTSSPS